jgi:hypothetical protein
MGVGIGSGRYRDGSGDILCMEFASNKYVCCCFRKWYMQLLCVHWCIVCNWCIPGAPAGPCVSTQPLWVFVPLPMLSLFLRPHLRTFRLFFWRFEDFFSHLLHMFLVTPCFLLVYIGFHVDFKKIG